VEAARKLDAVSKPAPPEPADNDGTSSRENKRLKKRRSTAGG